MTKWKKSSHDEYLDAMVPKVKELKHKYGLSNGKIAKKLHTSPNNVQAMLGKWHGSNEYDAWHNNYNVIIVERDKTDQALNVLNKAGISSRLPAENHELFEYYQSKL